MINELRQNKLKLLKSIIFVKMIYVLKFDFEILIKINCKSSVKIN